MTVGSGDCQVCSAPLLSALPFLYQKNLNILNPCIRIYKQKARFCICKFLQIVERDVRLLAFLFVYQSGLIFARIIFSKYPGFWPFPRNIIRAKYHKVFLSVKFNAYNIFLWSTWKKRAYLKNENWWQKSESKAIIEFSCVSLSLSNKIKHYNI